MSEYQYYEFLAIDRPLSAADMRWLRGLTTRAQITATSLTNTYHWGSFKGDPYELLKRCFDAHLYTSNFGSRWFMLKLPSDVFDSRAAKAYLGRLGGQHHSFGDSVVLDFSVEGEPDSWEDDADDGTGWMASLAPLRAELLNGDWRSLYLAWLVNVQHDELEPDTREPRVPAGLGALSAPSDALVDFLGLDRTLIALAAERSPPLIASEISKGDWLAFVADLTAKERDDLLLQFLMHDDPAMRRKLRERFRNGRSVEVKKRDASEGRTVGELATEWRRRVATAQQRAANKAAREREGQVEEQARVRRERLIRLAGRGAAAWDEVERLIQSRSPKNYDQAVGALADLRDAAAYEKPAGDFTARLGRLRAAHASKPSLIRRLDVAGLR